MKNTIDYFESKSKSWDMNSSRVQNAKSISEFIVKNINLSKNMEIMDFGAGTGLLSYFVAPYVAKIVALDNSPSMLKKFKEKRDEFACATEVLEEDLHEIYPERKFDGIVSSMTMHHIEDIDTLLFGFYQALHRDGFIALADLDKEDGSFHSSNTGVFHYGFDREMLREIALKIGFKEIFFETASIIDKPHCKFSVFLMTAKK
jgi:cyclopropane fatty-acyl-phospholipid synthase-like methyltransferase